MPLIMREVSVGAGATDPNLLAGSTFEFVRGNVFISAGCVAAATGTFIQFLSGADIVLEESPPFVIAAAGSFPIIPDHMYFNDVATIADRIVMSARNPTGGAVVHRPLLQLTNLR